MPMTSSFEMSFKICYIDHQMFMLAYRQVKMA